MSREVRRVPLGWQHPTEPNPYWFEQTVRSLQRRECLSRLHLPQERFIGLMDDFAGRLADWTQELDDMKARRGHSWEFDVEYYLTGFKGQDDEEPTVHPFHEWDDDGQNTHTVELRDIDHLHELCVARVESERPDPDCYMPVWAPAEATGWVLYETVSEGTPVTPVFATPDELVEHLSTVGQDWDQEPMRRASAEALVKSGSSFGSMVVVGGRLLDGSKDMDVLTSGTAS